jgi:hypothetical protein
MRTWYFPWRSTYSPMLHPPSTSHWVARHPRAAGRTRIIDSPNHSSRLSTPDTVSSNPSSIPVIPPTTLCMCIFLGFKSQLTYPLVRLKPFWRHTHRSLVTGTFYASSLHRSTFIVAGLRFDKPIADLSALGVESCIGIVVLLPESLPAGR